MLNLLESSLFDTIAGLPVHPLVVHAAVVLLPLSALAAIAALVGGRRRPALLRTALWTGVLGAAAAVVAKESGEALARRIGEPTQHAQLGDVLPYVAAGYLVLLLVWWWLARRPVAGRATGGAARVDALDGRPAAPTAAATPSGGAGRVLAALAALAGLAVLVLTTLVGHTGAVAAWSDAMTAGPQPSMPAPTPSR